MMNHIGARQRVGIAFEIAGSIKDESRGLDAYLFTHEPNNTSSKGGLGELLFVINKHMHKEVVAAVPKKEELYQKIENTFKSPALGIKKSKNSSKVLAALVETSKKSNKRIIGAGIDIRAFEDPLLKQPQIEDKPEAKEAPIVLILDDEEDKGDSFMGKTAACHALMNALNQKEAVESLKAFLLFFGVNQTTPAIEETYKVYKKLLDVKNFKAKNVNKAVVAVALAKNKLVEDLVAKIKTKCANFGYDSSATELAISLALTNKFFTEDCSNSFDNDRWVTIALSLAVYFKGKRSKSLTTLKEILLSASTEGEKKETVDKNLALLIGSIDGAVRGEVEDEREIRACKFDNVDAEPIPGLPPMMAPPLLLLKPARPWFPKSNIDEAIKRVRVDFVDGSPTLCIDHSVFASIISHLVEEKKDTFHLTNQHVNAIKGIISCREAYPKVWSNPLEAFLSFVFGAMPVSASVCAVELKQIFEESLFIDKFLDIFAKILYSVEQRGYVFSDRMKGVPIDMFKKVKIALDNYAILLSCTKEVKSCTADILRLFDIIDKQ